MMSPSNTSALFSIYLEKDFPLFTELYILSILQQIKYVEFFIFLLFVQS